MNLDHTSPLAKRARLLATLGLAAGLMLPAATRAADVDIYSGIGGATGAPNVLIIMDNAANFDAATTAAPCIINGATNTMAKSATTNSAGGIEQCALYNVIANLPATVNIGFMIYNGPGMKDFSGSTVCTTAGATGGCLAYPLAPMNAANKAALLNWIAGWTPMSVKTNSQATAEAMQEAWAYYAGQTGLSGRNYAAIQPPGGCQKNFLIFIGNAFTSSSTPGDAPTTSASSLASAYTTATALNPSQPPYPGMILGTVKTSCAPGFWTFDTTDPSHNNNGEYMDEWSRFMRGTDIFGAVTGQQNIITYTVGLTDPASCKPIYPALMSSAANYGGGKYFEVSTYNDIINAILKILNEVQAINSVFSSATLPVSVNTQGTYLNQIYMGMFRPDSLGNPRWVGNVKQYQFQFDTAGNLFLADATRQPAISSAGTGFITPGAASFWSCTFSGSASLPPGPAQQAGYPTVIPYSTLPNCANDPTIGYWANNGTYVASSAGKAFDLPDGEVVEKGGVSQQVRLNNLNAIYPNPAAGITTDSPRRMFTYCPSGAGCVADLTDPTNHFDVGNAGITTTMYGVGLNLAVTSLTRNGMQITVATAGAHGLNAGNTVSIAGATPNDYNGLVTVTAVLDATHFTYNIGYEYPPSPATTTTTAGVGGYVATQWPAVTYPTTLSRAPAGTAANATVTAVTSTVNPYVTGQQVTIAYATPSNYNLSPTVTVVTTGSKFTYPVAIQPTPTPVGTYSADLFYNTAIPIATATCAAKLVTITTSVGHNFVNGDWVTISGDTQATKPFNTSVNITWTSSTSFTYPVTVCPSASPTTATMKANSGPATPLAVTMTRNETVVGLATVTATVNGTNQFAQGDRVVVAYTGAAGTQPANESYYLVSGASITCAIATGGGTCGANGNGTTTFTYTIVTAPATQAVPVTGQANILSFPFNPASSQTISALTRVYPGGTTATATLAANPTYTGFCNGDIVNVSTAAGTTLAAREGAYTGSWTITGLTPCQAGTTCVAATTTCSNGTVGTAYSVFTYGALVTTPASPATGTISASNPNFVPDRTTLTNWVRGEDNYGDEQSLCPPGVAAGTSNCPSPAVTVRPSVHGDTLHSRPIAINYGGNIGVVVFYGTNDGVYHAANGNQPPCTVTPCPSPVPPSTITWTNASGTTVSVPPGGELWGFISAEFFTKLNRQRTNSPPLLLPTTPAGITPQPQPKDYFIDGPTGIYQAIDGTGTTTKAIIYVGDRRGGRALTALDVTNPLRPVRLWRIDNSTPGFGELGQTWSLPKIIPKLKGYCGTAACTSTPAYQPVLVFGAGYDDGAEDSEPPFSSGFNGFAGNIGADNMGRGIFIIDAFTGALVWQSTHFDNAGSGWPYYWFYQPSSGAMGSFCDGTPAGTTGMPYVCHTMGMNYSIPADVTLVDRDSDGFTDRLYATDTGGNIWRVDFEPKAGVTPDKWQISNLAALGCEWGPCDTQLWSWPTFANPANVQRKFFFPAEFIPALSGGSYDMVFVSSGDREHPLYVDPASTAANPLPLATSPPYNVSAQAVVNRIYMIKDFNTGKDAMGTTATQPWVFPTNEHGWTISGGTSHPLDDCTGTALNPNTCSTATTGAASPLPYNRLTATQQHGGYYITLLPGEKGVNAPLVTAGFVYLGTNQPTPVTPNTCTSNLGIARGYQLNPYSGAHGSIVYDGGGLPPSPVSGIVDIVTDAGVVQSPFCIGCPSAINPNANMNCNNSALAACKPSIQVNSARRRNYWYLNNR